MSPLGFVASLSDLSSYEFNNIDVGAAAPDRLIVIAVHAATNVPATYTGLTLNGQPATKLISAGETVGPGGPTAIFAVPFPAGQTASVGVALSNGVVRCGVAMWAVYGLQSVTPVAVKSHASTSPVSMTLEVMSGGLMVAALTTAADGSVVTTWADLDESYDEVMVEGTPTLVSGAVKVGLPQASMYDVDVSATTGNRTIRAVAVSFR